MTTKHVDNISGKYLQFVKDIAYFPLTSSTLHGFTIIFIIPTNNAFLKDTLKAFDGFKNKQKSTWGNVFLVYKSIYILKVYSIH